VCAACQLAARVDQLAAGAGPEIAHTLAPFLGDLARAENPRSMMRWFCCPGFGITRGLLAGEIPISHAGLDEAAVEAANAVAFVRAKLVTSGVLEPRDEASARFAAWHGTAVLQVAPGADRAHVRAYATWQVAHQLAQAIAVDWDDRPATRPAIDDEQRFGILRRLLHDQELDLRDRFAGSVLLLYGKPITRIVALRTTDIRTTPDGVITLRLGRGEIPLPEPLGPVAQVLRD
jgi:hypothetical protein